MKKQLVKAWLIGMMTGAGIVIAWQIGDAQRRLVEAWQGVFHG